MKIIEWYAWKPCKTLDPIYPDSYGIWVRLFGIGIHVQTSKGHVPLFSERAGHVKGWYFCGLRFQFLGSVY